MSIPARLAHARQQAGYTQYSARIALYKEAGVHLATNTIAHWEDPKHESYHLAKLAPLCTLYGVSLDWVATGRKP